MTQVVLLEGSGLKWFESDYVTGSDSLSGLRTFSIFISFHMARDSYVEIASYWNALIHDAINVLISILINALINYFINALSIIDQSVKNSGQFLSGKRFFRFLTIRSIF